MCKWQQMVWFGRLCMGTQTVTSHDAIYPNLKYWAPGCQDRSVRWNSHSACSHCQSKTEGQPLAVKAIGKGSTTYEYNIRGGLVVGQERKSCREALQLSNLQSHVNERAFHVFKPGGSLHHDAVFHRLLLLLSFSRGWRRQRRMSPRSKYKDVSEI